MYKLSGYINYISLPISGKSRKFIYPCFLYTKVKS